MKVFVVEVGGSWCDVYKDLVMDKGKWFKKGVLVVIKDNDGIIKIIFY